LDDRIGVAEAVEGDVLGDTSLLNPLLEWGLCHGSL